MNANQTGLDIKSLETWLWDAACKLRGPIDAPKFKDYILPLIFLKRLSDVYEDEVKKFAEKMQITIEKAEKIVESDHNNVRFYLPKGTRWSDVQKQTVRLGEYLTDVVRKISSENEKLNGVIDIIDFNESAGGQRIISDDALKGLIEVLSKYRLGLDDVEPDILGRAYEYLLRKFAEGSGQSAGEFYTPGEVAILMSHILDPEPGDEVYDPCCGSGGLLIKAYIRFKEKFKIKENEEGKIDPVKFFGQEIQHSTFAMAKMNVFIHDMEAEIALGDTMNQPAFLTPQGSLRKFDLVTANPMWNQDFSQTVYENDNYNRFTFGYPPSNSADWGWIQHMYASLNDKGKMAVVLDTGAVSRGSGNAGSNRERDIRKQFVENDLVEAVLLLPENLFYNTTAPGIIIVINKAKPKERKNKILLINASKLFQKGRPKNYLPDESITLITDKYLSWNEEEGISKIITKEEAARNDYNLSPSRYVAKNGEDDTLDLEDAIVQLKEAEEERKQADEKLKTILKEMGVWQK
jgi:type I restriction enzyme M protein